MEKMNRVIPQCAKGFFVFTGAVIIHFFLICTNSKLDHLDYEGKRDWFTFSIHRIVAGKFHPLRGVWFG